MSIVALDLGRRRIGIAIAESDGSLPRPLGTLERRSTAHDIDALRHKFAGRGVERAIVGLPVNMDGSEGPMAAMAREFARRLTAALALPVELHDERLTSFEAEARLRESGASAGRRKAAVDALAATIILESWLSARTRTVSG